jgi:hypothetical protein
VCDDPRQFVGPDGQQWTTLEELRRNHQNILREEEPGLWSITTDPPFAIGQRAFVVRTPEGNLLWDCAALLDQSTVDAIIALGGVRAIAISHPHYYTTMFDWSAAFSNAPVFIHELDREWVMRPETNVAFWSGETKDLFGGLSLHCTGGHFAGFQVAHWPHGAAGSGVLLAGDQPQVCADTRWVSFMYSYPNYIPLGTDAVHRIVHALDQLPFERIYGAFRTMRSQAKSALHASADRFLKAID